MADEKPGGAAVAEPPAGEQEPAQIQGDVAGTSDADAGRESAPSEQIGQSQSGGDEGTTDPRAAFFKDMTAEEFDRLIETAPDELKQSSAVLKETERRAEQRGAQTVAEAQQKQQQSADLYDSLINIGYQAQDWLDGANQYVAEQRQILAKAIKDDEPEAAANAQAALDQVLGSEDWAAAPQAIAHAARLSTAKQHTEALRESLGKYTPLLGELTDDERTLFTQARKHDEKNGTAVAQGMMLDLIVGKAIELGEKRGRGELEKNTTADDALLKRVDGWMKAKGGVAPAVPGRASATGPLTLEEANSLSIDELKRRTGG